MGTRWHRGATLLGTGIVSTGLIFGSSTMAAAAPHDSADDVPIAQTNLVSDQVGHAPLVDANLVNPWGMSYGAATPVWVSDNGKDVSTLYSGNTFPPAFTKANLTVSIPGGEPTGQVFNSSTTDFVVTNGTSGPAKFIFASEAGWITGWNPNVPTTGSTQATPAKQIPNAVFKGLALANFDGANYLYATDFNHAKVDVFDSTFGLQHWNGAFQDSAIPSGYAPFNVQLLNGSLYVTYAKQDAAKHDDFAGKGHGFVDVFTTGGQLVKRLVRNGDLNSPWGLAIAPSSWGELAG
ncbi:MAG TPA: TIGR03118 family protein, partial [Acidothermaceae bacterium]